MPQKGTPKRGVPQTIEQIRKVAVSNPLHFGPNPPLKRENASANLTGKGRRKTHKRRKSHRRR